MIVNLNVRISVLLFLLKVISAVYEADWDSLDQRPIPSWYDEGKVGIFIHWGVYSVPSFGYGTQDEPESSFGEWFMWNWKGLQDENVLNFMKENYPPNFKYEDFAHQFTAEFFNPDQWADLFKASGARYVVLTSKHHDGFTNWPSAQSVGWNSIDLGPQRDLVGDLAAAIQKIPSLHFGLYYSLFEWFNLKYLQDKKNDFETEDYIREKMVPELFDIVNQYHPHVLWVDGEWDATSEYWDSEKFLSWLYGLSPVKDDIVTNDRWGNDTTCKHGGYFTCNELPRDVLHEHKWENGVTIDKSSWGYRRNVDIDSYMTIKELLKELIITISCNGNFLVNIGPTKEGTISPIFEERLRQMGEWLGVNGEAVYGSKPWKHQNDTLNPNVWYTTNNDKVYAFVLSWSPIIELGSPHPTSPSSKFDMIGGKSDLTWAYLEPIGCSVGLPWFSKSTPVIVIRMNGVE